MFTKPGRFLIPGVKENSSNAKDTLPVVSGEQVLLEQSLCDGGGVELWGSHSGEGSNRLNMEILITDWLITSHLT